MSDENRPPHRRDWAAMGADDNEDEGGWPPPADASDEPGDRPGQRALQGSGAATPVDDERRSTEEGRPEPDGDDDGAESSTAEDSHTGTSESESETDDPAVEPPDLAQPGG